MNTITSTLHGIDKYSDHCMIFGIFPAKIETNELRKISFTKLNKNCLITSLKNGFENLSLFDGDTEQKCKNLMEFVGDCVANSKNTYTVKTRKQNFMIPAWADEKYIKLCSMIHNLSEKISKNEYCMENYENPILKN